MGKIKQSLGMHTWMKKSFFFKCKEVITSQDDGYYGFDGNEAHGRGLAAVISVSWSGWCSPYDISMRLFCPVSCVCVLFCNKNVNCIDNSEAQLFSHGKYWVNIVNFLYLIDIYRAVL